MAVQGGLSLGARFFVAVCPCRRGAQPPACAKKGDGFRKIKKIPHLPVRQQIPPMKRFYASYRQELFPAAEMARKVIVACLNVTVLAVVGAPAIGGSSSPGSSAKG